MSVPAAGKFQDHYAVLEINPNATREQVEAARERLCRRYDPYEGEEPDEEKFEAVRLAAEVLSDPGLRREFDKLKGIAKEEPPKFSGAAFFEALARPSGLRSAVLCVLYDRRRLHPFTPAVPMRQMLSMLHASEEEINFALWYLKQRNLVVYDDKTNLMITADGLDFLENQRPSPEVVMQFIRFSEPLSKN
jgi:hypothetical protein